MLYGGKCTVYPNTFKTETETKTKIISKGMDTYFWLSFVSVWESMKSYKLWMKLLSLIGRMRWFKCDQLFVCFKYTRFPFNNTNVRTFQRLADACRLALLLWHSLMLGIYIFDVKVKNKSILAPSSIKSFFFLSFFNL